MPLRTGTHIDFRSTQLFLMYPQAREKWVLKYPHFVADLNIVDYKKKEFNVLDRLVLIRYPKSLRRSGPLNYSK